MPRIVHLSLAALALTTVASGCSLVDVQTIEGSGDIVTKEYPIADFDGLDVSRGWAVEIVAGDEFEVRVSADDNVGQHLEVELTGAILRLDIDDAVNLEDATVGARVTLPAVARIALHSGATVRMEDPSIPDDLELRLTGGSDLTCSGIDTGTFSVDLAGGSNVECLDVNAHTLGVVSTGGSRLRLTGQIASAGIEGSGASVLDLAGVSLAGADVTLSGGSEADLDVSGMLEADLRGGAEVRYAGDPVIGRSELESGSTLEPVP